MTVWVDADSCAAPAREIMLRRAGKTGTPLVFVACKPAGVGPQGSVRVVCVPQKDQSADRYIIEHIAEHDIVVTRDILLAEELVRQDRVVINDRGDEYTRENIGERRSIRDFMYELRTVGIQNDTGRRYGPKEKKRFADTFDRVLQRSQHLRTV
jgi:uncharacterized protein